MEKVDIMRRKRKEEYEIDPNSSFNKLRKLQMTLKEEVALTDIFFENRDELLKKIQTNCFEYFKERIAIQEIYDNNSYENKEKNKKIKYEVLENAPSLIPQCSDIVSKLLFYFRNSNELTLKLIEKCPKESYEVLANFLCNYFYVNIFSSTFLNESLLTLIYLLLEKEVDNIKDEKKSFFSFLDSSGTFVAVLLKYLSRRDEVKNYLENVMKKLLIRTAGLLPNQKNKMFLGLEINKIKNGIIKKYDLPKTKKNVELNELLTMDIKKSRLNMPFLSKTQKKKTEIIDKENDDIELTNEEIENNFYVQATKETFDDLLLGTEENDFDEIEKLTNEEGENKPEKKMDFFGANSTHKKKREGKDDFENYLIKSGFYNKPINKEMTEEEKALEEEEKKKRKEEEEIIEKNKDKIYSDLYKKKLNRETLLSLNEEQIDGDMEEYLMNKINDIQEEKMDFTNDKLLERINSLSDKKTFLEKIILVYKYHLEVIKQFIDELFISLIKNQENTPYIIRAICTIISKLLEIKFPKITNIQKISFISEFLFTNLIYPNLNNTYFNGIMMYNFLKEKEISNLRNAKIIAISKVLKKLLRGEFYDSNKENELPYILFNSYFIELMPHVIDFFRNISSTKLPFNIEKLLEFKKAKTINQSSDEQRNIEFDFLKAHNEERMEHQSICISLKELFAIYNILKTENNGEYILGDKNDKKNIQYKTYSKLSFHIDNLNKINDKDIQESKKTYVFFTQLIADEKLNEKINEKKDKKISFQSKQDLSAANNETFILSRVKYCINTIIKHLNPLSKTNFFVDEKESTENFVKGLNKMISLEGFSEMLKEKTLPIEWFGLYLQSNIENIPSEYKSHNYAQLYNELIEESTENLEKIQNDNSLNTIYSKIINSEKMIDISKNNLKRIKSNQKKFEILDFILKAEIPITIYIYRNDQKEISQIKFCKKEEEPKYNKSQNEEMKTIDCKNIVEFCENFPFLSRENSTDILEFEEQIDLKNSLNEYFKIIHEYVNIAFSEENEKTRIKIQIEDFIHAQIYDKIYSGMAVINDINIFRKCFTLKWIKPTMLNEKLTYLDEKMIQMMRSFIRNIDDEISPNNKLREFEKLDLIINNMITLYGYTKDVYLSILIFAFIKGQPFQLNSSYKYINMYYSESLPKERGIELINKFKNLLDKITNFSEKDLVGISKEEYDKNIEEIILSMNSN
jgi:hypothetical protein